MLFELGILVPLKNVMAFSLPLSATTIEGKLALVCFDMTVYVKKQVPLNCNSIFLRQYKVVTKVAGTTVIKFSKRLWKRSVIVEFPFASHVRFTVSNKQLNSFNGIYI